MIQITNTQVTGFEAAIRGMRNPRRSWDKSDSSRCSQDPDDLWCAVCEYRQMDACVDGFVIGSNDAKLAYNLSKNGHSSHCKYRRMITVYTDILAPLYWWKEFDTYKVGTVANSTSSLYDFTNKEFTLDDFSHDHLFNSTAMILNDYIIKSLNQCRKRYLETNDKKYWWQMVQLLPSSFNQMRTVMMNYEVLANIYETRKNHRLDEWNQFREWIEELPLSCIITLNEQGGADGE